MLVPQDAWALADAEFQPLLARARDALASLIDAPVTACAWAAPETLPDWRGVYATACAFEGWQVHGACITEHQPQFGPAIGARWWHASQVGADAAATAREQAVRIRAHVRSLVGTDGIAVLPSAASPAPRRDADAAAVGAVRLRTMDITCIAGLAGLPQVSLPLCSAGGQPLGVSLLGPAGSDLALVRLATRLHEILG